MAWNRRLGPWLSCVAAAIGVPAFLHAQVPGIPTLQNAFANPGLVGAGNFGSGGGQSFFGAAAGYGMAGGKLLVSGAAGVQRANSATRGAYGGRASLAVWESASGALGAAAFAGVGGAARTRDEVGEVSNPAVLNVPLGVSLGYRRPIGMTRGISAYVSPMYRWTRLEAEEVASSGNFSVAVGLDVALTQSFGATAGAEFGRTGGSTSNAIGIALSFVPGR